MMRARRFATHAAVRLVLTCSLLAGPAFTAAQQLAPLVDDRLGLNLKPAMRMYIRMGYTAVRPNDRSSDVRDLTGPVVHHGDEFTPGLNPQYAQALLLLSNSMQQDHPVDFRSQGLGTPRGATVNAGGTGAPTVSIGAYMDEAQHWAIEAYVLGLPFEVSVRGAGRIGGQGADSVDLGEVMRTKQLGPIVFGKHVFGHKDDRFRPSIGLGAAYIAFFDTKASDALARYAGGRTSVTLKNAYGPGIFLGGDYRLDERWSLHANLGYLKLKTEGMIITHADPAILSRSPVVIQAAQDVGPNTLTALRIINGTTFNSPDLVPGIMEQLAIARTGDPGNIGTYVRKIDSKLDPWLLTLSVGYAF